MGQEEDARLHSAGATIRHVSPFLQLPDWRNAAALDQAFLDTWIIPYYGQLRRTDPEWAALLQSARTRLNGDVILQLLGDFNWRSRQTGAYFAALLNQTECTDIIGTQLLKSECCYAGKIYALVLAFFNTAASVAYLQHYLNYYLHQPQHWFDQQEVLGALAYLDGVNATALAAGYGPAWEQFIQNKPGWKPFADASETAKIVDFLRRFSGSHP